MREFQAVILNRARIERHTLVKPVVHWADAHRDGWHELRVIGAKIRGIFELGIGEPRIERGMAIGAECLRSRCHFSSTLMLGMAIDTAASRVVKGGLEQALDPLAKAQPFLRTGDPCRIGMAVRIVLVACEASLVRYGLELVHMTGLTIAGEALVRDAQGSARPHLVGMESCRPLLDAMRGGIGIDRPGKK